VNTIGNNASGQKQKRINPYKNRPQLAGWFKLKCFMKKEASLLELLALPLSELSQ